MKKCKVLFHINSMGKGGAERVVSVLSGYFAQDGYEVVVATQWYAGEEYALPAKVKRVHAGLSETDEKKGRLYRAVKRAVNFRKTVKAEKPDIVISFCNKANFRSAYCMIGMKTPLLVSVRNDPGRDYAPYRRATKWMERKAAGCVFQTPDARDFFSPAFRAKSRIIFNPLSEQYRNAAKQPVKRDSRIVTVGRVTAQKNQLLLLKAFAKIHENYPEVQLEIYGEDDGQGTKEQLERFIDEKNLQQKVRFMGQSSQPEKDIAGAALFVLSSDYEGMPNALMEAMSLGLPVISTDCPCGGSRILIEDGVSGLLVPAGDEDRLARAMELLLSDRERAEEMGKEARKIADKVSSDKIYQEWKDYVDTLTGKRTIAFYISSLRKGGAERVIVNLAEHFKKEGYRTVIVTTRKAEKEYEISEGIKRRISEPEAEELNRGRIGNFRLRFLTLRRIWKEERPSLILSFIGKNNMMAILTSAFLKIPAVVSVRGNPPSEYPSKGMKFVADVLFKRAAGIVLQTQRSFSFFSKAVQKKAVVLENPLNPAFLKPPFMGERKNEIVSVGILDENKNQAMLVEAFAGVAGEFPEMELVLYGEGEKGEELETLAKKLGIGGKVHLPGQCEHVQDAIDKARIFVLTSDTEGSPNAVIEAMSLGLAVISTDCPCGGPAELIRDGENGLLVPVREPKALEEALRRILRSPDLEKKLQTNALQIRERMNPEKINGKWQQYLERFLPDG